MFSLEDTCENSLNVDVRVSCVNNGMGTYEARNVYKNIAEVQFDRFDSCQLSVVHLPNFKRLVIDDLPSRTVQPCQMVVGTSNAFTVRIANNPTRCYPKVVSLQIT